MPQPTGRPWLPAPRLIAIIFMRIADERKRPSRSNHPSANILAFDKAYPERAAVLVRPGEVAIPGASGRKPDQFIAGSNPAGPFRALRVKADLITLRCIDAGEA